MKISYFTSGKAFDITITLLRAAKPAKAMKLKKEVKKLQAMVGML